jgi:phosphoenolpyruvate-protein kinase (PTS system EI component)
MVEVPSVVAVLEDVLAEADFGSVGTNDLVQYLLAADRNNDRMVGYYDPLHPAVLRNLASIAFVARRLCKELSVCGEVAGDPLYVPLLIGLGFRTLSASPGAIPFLKDCIRHVSVQECEELAMRTLHMKTADDIRQAVMRHRQVWRKSAKDAPCVR